MSDLIIILSRTPWLFILLSVMFAAVVGSFLNVLIHRLPVMLKRQWQQECEQFLAEQQPQAYAQLQQQQLLQPLDHYPKRYNLVVPGSACTQCGHAIRPWHNIPILGWLCLQGRCADCQHPISRRYPLVELLTAAAVGVLAWHFGPTWQFLLATVLTCLLIALAGIDLDEMLLPDQLTLPLLWLGLLANLQHMFVPLPDALIGAVAGYLSLWSVFWVFKLLTGKEGMGYGDFKLLALFGAWLGWQMLPLIILLSSLVGAVVGLTLMSMKKVQRSQAIPFGPYIVMAGWVALLWGDEILHWYLGTR